MESELCDAFAQITDGPLREVTDARRRFDKTNADHERARAKFLGLTKDAKEEHLRAAEDDLASTRHEFETARFALMSKLQHADAVRRTVFKRQLARSVRSHRQFHERALRAYTELTPFVDEVEVRCDDDEERAGLDAVDLGTAAAAYREALTTDTQLAAPSDFEALSLSSDRSRGLAAIMAAHEGEGIHTRLWWYTLGYKHTLATVAEATTPKNQDRRRGINNTEALATTGATPASAAAAARFFTKGTC